MEVMHLNAEQTGKFIGDRRKELNMTQRELADMIHVSDKAVSRWETGKGFPDIHSLEDLASALDVSLVELLKGEKIETPVDTRYVDNVAAEGLQMADKMIRKRVWMFFAAGFLIGLILITLFVVHINSPIVLTANSQDDVVRIEALGDGSRIIIPVIPNTECTVERFKENDSGAEYCQVSCHTTRLMQWLNKGRTQAVIVETPVDVITYYPGADGDVVLYSGIEMPAGMITLPRLVYNYWMVLGILFSILLMAVYLILKIKHKHYAWRWLATCGLPMSFTIAIFGTLIGHFSEIYNAPFYFTGILLLTVFIYTLFLCILFLVRDHIKAKRSNSVRT